MNYDPDKNLTETETGIGVALIAVVGFLAVMGLIVAVLFAAAQPVSG